MATIYNKKDLCVLEFTINRRWLEKNKTFTVDNITLTIVVHSSIAYSLRKNDDTQCKLVRTIIKGFDCYYVVPVSYSIIDGVLMRPLRDSELEEIQANYNNSKLIFIG